MIQVIDDHFRIETRGDLGYPMGTPMEPRLHFQWRRQLHLQGRVGVVEPLGGAVAVNGLVCSWRFHGISWIQWDEMRWFLVGKTSPPTMGILHGQQLWNFHEKWWLKQPQMGISWGFDGYHLKNYPGWWNRGIPKSFNLIPFPFANPIDQTAQVTQVEVRSWSEFRLMNSSGLIVACTTRLTTLCAPVAVHC